MAERNATAKSGFLGYGVTARFWLFSGAQAVNANDTLDMCSLQVRATIHLTCVRSHKQKTKIRPKMRGFL